MGLVWAHSQPRSWLELPAALSKTGRSRCIPLCTEAQQAVRELVGFLVQRGFPSGPAAPVLTDRRHRRLPTREVQRVIQRYRHLAALEVQATPHSLRHGFATQLVNPGCAAPFGAATARAQAPQLH